MSEEKAKQEGWHKQWEGNDLADKYAKSGYGEYLRGIKKCLRVFPEALKAMGPLVT